MAKKTSNVHEGNGLNFHPLACVNAESIERSFTLHVSASGIKEKGKRVRECMGQKKINEIAGTERKGEDGRMKHLIYSTF